MDRPKRYKNYVDRQRSFDRRTDEISITPHAPWPQRTFESIKFVPLFQNINNSTYTAKMRGAARRAAIREGAMVKGIVVAHSEVKGDESADLLLYSAWYNNDGSEI